MNIAFLHTSAVHIKTFNTLLADECQRLPQLKLNHHVREQWLTEAMQTGIGTELSTQVSGFLLELAEQNDSVVCTCSSLGSIAQQLNKTNIFRIDQPMMNLAAVQAIEGKQPALLTMCLPSTQEPSETLFKQALIQQGIPIAQLTNYFESIVLDDLWIHFENRALDTFAKTIGDRVIAAIETANKETDVSTQAYSCVVLAQASMAAAQGHLADLPIPVFTSAQLAANHALQLARSAM